MTEIENVDYAIRFLKRRKKKADNYTRPFLYGERQAVNIALKALQEKQEREKGCGYCNNHRPLLALYTEYTMEIDDRDLSVWQGLKCEGTLKISFCPMCGRKLEDKL